MYRPLACLSTSRHVQALSRSVSQRIRMAGATGATPVGVRHEPKHSRDMKNILRGSGVSAVADRLASIRLRWLAPMCVRRSLALSFLSYALRYALSSAPAYALGADQAQKLIAGGGESGDGIGYSVAIDGDTALIGAYKESQFWDGKPSAVYVFTRQRRWLDGASENRVPELDTA